MTASSKVIESCMVSLFHDRTRFAGRSAHVVARLLRAARNITLRLVRLILMEEQILEAKQEDPCEPSSSHPCSSDNRFEDFFDAF